MSLVLRKDNGEKYFFLAEPITLNHIQFNEQLSFSLVNVLKIQLRRQILFFNYVFHIIIYKACFQSLADIRMLASLEIYPT